MHQISLLGGLGTDRHGSGSHYMRPDRVYRTSVLQSMVGYRPGYDVQQVAHEFTVGPQTGMTLSGLRGLGALDKLRIWWHGVKARARGGVPAGFLPPGRAQQIPTSASEPVLHAPGASVPPSRGGWAGDEIRHGYSMAPQYTTAQIVGPSAQGVVNQLVGRAWGQSPSLPAFAEEAAAKTTMMRWRGLRFPWG
jgi:hypothetical protein